MTQTNSDISNTNACALVVTLGLPHERPWWWKDLETNGQIAHVGYERLNFRNKLSQQISLIETPFFMLKVLVQLLKWRGRHEYVFSFECDLVGLSICFWQTILNMSRPKHVILHFIMREKNSSLASIAKYRFLRFVFFSVWRVFVSTRHEINYYKDAFGWAKEKTVFLPLFTDPELLIREPRESPENYGIAAGRTFRDYDTLVKAVEGTTTKIVIVGGEGTVERYGKHPNIRALENIPSAELDELISLANWVAVPLHMREISIGQSVILQAMALGKPVIASEVPGTSDYIESGVDGLLVPPYDHLELRSAIASLESIELRQRIGQAAREKIAQNHLPHHFTAQLRSYISTT
ncbi:MAG: glycosyltransferase family 4 protein [Pseudomonadales bacterium]